jgi:hypothetical protein
MCACPCVLQDLRVYCSEVVGMLREKDPMIAQLRDVALQTKGARSKALKARRVEEQEDLIYRVREVGGRGGVEPWRMQCHY